MKIRPRLPAALLAASLVAGCSTGPLPGNRADGRWMPAEASRHLAARADAPAPSPLLCGAAPAPAGFDPAAYAPPESLGGAAPLAPGDRLRLRLAGDSDRVSGVYVIGEDGRIAVPGLAPLAAAGTSPAALEGAIGSALVAAGIAQPLGHPVDLRLIESAGVTVAVSGAVFDPGSVRAGERSAEGRIGQREGITSGDANGGRSLVNALRAAGGVRPDADVGQVYLARGARWTRLDLSAVTAGAGLADLAITAGDRIVVPSSGCFHPELARASAITPPGIRVYMSNLTRSANNNAGAAVGRDSTSLPYGTRMLQGLVAMNCVGGSALNRGRRAVLISRNPMTGTSIVIQRDVERLVRDAGRDDYDPSLMPGDAIACYDSRWMALSDAIGLVSGAVSLATPALLLRNSVR